MSELLRPLSKNNKINLKIPSKIIVENKGYEVGREEVKQALLQQWQPVCGHCKIEFQSLSIPLIPLAYQQEPWRVNTRGNLPRGSFSAPIQFLGKKQPPGSFWVSGQVSILRKVPVTKRSIRMGERIAAKDVSWKYKDVTFAYDGTPDLKNIIGRKSRVSMKAGQIVWVNSIIKEKAVSRGQIIKVVLGDDRFEIVLQAKAEQDGYVGDRVKLKNLKTDKIFSGVVTRLGEVIVR